eukprot:COSAG02_NODE_6799_length_3354_cov_92.971619_3_plen_155_part_00
MVVPVPLRSCSRKFRSMSAIRSHTAHRTGCRQTRGKEEKREREKRREASVPSLLPLGTATNSVAPPPNPSVRWASTVTAYHCTSCKTNAARVSVLLDHSGVRALVSLLQRGRPCALHQCKHGCQLQMCARGVLDRPAERSPFLLRFANVLVFPY